MAAAELLSRHQAEDSLYQFTQQAWSLSEGGRTFVPNWHLEVICEHIEAMFAGQLRNLLINLPPRMAKSCVASVMVAPWGWIKNPSMQFLYVSYSQDLSVRDSRKGRQIIESPWYQARWGERFRIVSDQNTKVRYDNDKGGYRLSSSVDAKVTGEGGDWLICDDPNNVRDRSDVMLQSATDWWQEVMPTRLNDFRRGCRLVIQQRMHERDISGHILSKDEGEWTKLILPMEFELRRRCTTVALPSTKGIRWTDPRKEEGELLFPERVGPTELALLKRELGSDFAISGQLQQRPAPEAGGIIRRWWFKLWTSPMPPKCDFTIVSVDTALTDTDKSAFNVALVLGVFRRSVDGAPNTATAPEVPHVILLSMWRKQCGYEITRSMLQRLARDYLDTDYDVPRMSRVPRKPDIVLVEEKATGGALIQDLMRTGISVQPFIPRGTTQGGVGDKKQRVHLIAPILAAQRVWLPGDPARDYTEPRPWVEPFMHECLSFPNAAHKDIVDCLSQALIYLTRFDLVFHPDDYRPGPPVREYEEEDFLEPAYY